MQKLLIATSNPGKLAEYQALLSDLPIELMSLADLGLSSIEETENTFEANALLKAHTYFKAAHLPVIADDGGFEIDALDGKPGVHSHRWVTGDENVTDEQIVEHTLKALQNIPVEKRTARMRTAAVFIDGKGNEHTVQAATEGMVPLQSGAIENGLPYRAILFIPQFKKLFSELSPEEHEAVNQRVHIVKKLKPILEKYFSSH